jgi:hypothetical protein
MESLINLFWYILYHGLGFGLGALLMGLVFLLKNRIDKINSLVRLLLIPIVMILILLGVTGVSNNLVALLAIFWTYDAESNIWFYSNLIIPALTSYALLWSVYMVAPFQKVIVTILVGLLWIGFFLYMSLGAMKYGFVFDGGYLFETFNIESSISGTVLFVISSIGGAVLAIKHSYDGDINDDLF